MGFKAVETEGIFFINYLNILFLFFFFPTAILEAIAEVLPLGTDMWQQVGEKVNARLEQLSLPPRDIESIKSKFRRLVNSTKPTGDPACPPDVKLAKQLHYRILRSCEHADLDDTAEDMRSCESFSSPSAALGQSSPAGDVTPPVCAMAAQTLPALSPARKRKTLFSTAMSIGEVRCPFLFL